MKRLLALLAGAFGLRALLRRRPRAAFPQGASPADELRTRLAESRSAPEPPPVSPDAADSPAASRADEPAVDEPGIDARRADVHNRARGAIDELKS